MSRFSDEWADALPNMDECFGEAICIIPRKSSDFSGFFTDNFRSEVHATARFTDESSIEKLRGASIGFQTNTTISAAHKIVRIDKVAFVASSDWPRQNDAIVRIETGERFRILTIKETGASLTIQCALE